MMFNSVYAAAVVGGILVLNSSIVSSFVMISSLKNHIKTCARSKQKRSRLYDIGEWRDIMFGIENTDSNSLTHSPLREICVLPFPFHDVLLQGETKELRLYEERFISLFDDAMENYGGTVAMGLIAENGIMQTVPLCEIEAFNRMDEFGIFVTIRVVSRATLSEVTKDTPYIKAICKELVDKAPKDGELEQLNLMAGTIELLHVALSSMDHRLNQEEDDDNDDESNDEEDNDAEYNLDRTGRFRRAFHIAKSTDSQGYISSKDEASSQRSLQELTAISWAAFQSDRLLEDDEDVLFAMNENGQLVASSEVLFRIQALSSSSLEERMKLALQYIQQKKLELKQSLEKLGIKYDNDDGMDM